MVVLPLCCLGMGWGPIQILFSSWRGSVGVVLCEGVAGVWNGFGYMFELLGNVLIRSGAVLLGEGGECFLPFTWAFRQGSVLVVATVVSRAGQVFTSDSGQW